MLTYYIYKRSSKECKELEEIVATLKQCLDKSDIPDKGINQSKLVALNLLITKWQP